MTLEKAIKLNSSLTLSWRRPLSYRNSPLICRENQWASFYMITVSVMKELNNTFNKRVILKTFLVLF